MQVFNALAEPKFTPEKANKVNAVRSAELEVDAYFIRAGQAHTWHRHENDHAVIGIGGTGSLVLDQSGEVKIPLAPGVVALAPKGVWHRIEATTDLTALTTSTFPVRVQERG